MIKAVNTRKYTEKIFIYILLFIYKIVLDIAYINFIYPIYDYVGFAYELCVVKLVESYFLLFITSLIIPKGSTIRPSHIIVFLFVIIAYIPMLSVYAMMNQPREYMYAVTLFFILISLLIRFPVVRINSIKSDQNRFLDIILTFIFVLMVLGACVYLFKNIGNLNFNIYKVYAIRDIYQNIDLGLMAYIISWTGYFLVPLLIGFLIVQKKYFLFLLVTVMQILLFSLTGMKTYLVLIPVCMIMVFLIRRKSWPIYFMLGLICLVSVGTFTPIIGDLLVRRSLFAPALISFNYFEYFNHLQPLYLSAHHMFSMLVDYPYDLGPSYLIGRAYLNNINTNVNTGIIADAFINFGYQGFFIWGIFLGLICHLIDSVSVGKDIRIISAVIWSLVICFTESALLTGLMSGGIIFAIIAIYLLPNRPSKSLTK